MRLASLLISKININTCIFFVMLSLTVMPLSQAYGKEIRIGLVESPPYLHVKQGKASGPLVEYIVEMLQGEGYRLSLQVLPTKRGSRELLKGNIDILVPTARVPGINLYLDKALYHSVPGLCFKKENFVPFLSSTSQFRELNIGVPAGTNLAPALEKEMININWIEGMDVLARGINLLRKERITALFHPSPINVYHFTNPLSKDIACSYFHGYSTGQYLAYSIEVDDQKLDFISRRFQSAMKQQSFEFFFATYMYDKRKLD